MSVAGSTSETRLGRRPPAGTRVSRWTRLRSRLPATAISQRTRESLLTLTAGLAASIPVIVATVRALQAHWVPIADRGIIATRAHDVFTAHMPLVGQYTLAGEVTGHVTHSLGPMLFWLLAIPAYYGSTVGMTLTMCTLNTLSIIGCVALARRHGGRVLMLMTALAIALMCQSLAAETFHDIWNPSAALFPFTLLIFLCWSLACGSYRLVPLTLVVASFVVQAHLTYLPPTLALLALGLGGLATGALLHHRRGSPRIRRRRALAWTLVSLLAVGACWSATVVGQLTERPGNVTSVVEAATQHKATLGGTVGWNAVVRAVGLPPWWLITPKSRWQRKYEVRSKPSRLASGSCIVLLAMLAVVCAAALVRRRRALAALALTGLVLCPALAAVAASTPVPRVLSATLGYTMWWGSQVGMTVWLALAWALWLGTRRLAERLRAASWSRLRPTTSLVATLLSVVAVTAVGSAVAAQGEHDEHVALYGAVRDIDAHLSELTATGSTILFEGKLDGATMPIKPAVRYFLVAHDERVLAPGSFLRLGSWYELYRRPYYEAIYLSDVPRAPAGRAQLAFATSFHEGKRRNWVYVWISRHRAAHPRR